MLSKNLQTRLNLPQIFHLTTTFEICYNLFDGSHQFPSARQSWNQVFCASIIVWPQTTSTNDHSFMACRVFFNFTPLQGFSLVATTLQPECQLRITIFCLDCRCLVPRSKPLSFQHVSCLSSPKPCGCHTQGGTFP